MCRRSPFSMIVACSVASGASAWYQRKLFVFPRQAKTGPYTHKQLSHDTHNSWIHLHTSRSSLSTRNKTLPPNLTHPHPHPRAIYTMRQWTVLPLVQVMAFCLFGAKPLSKPMLGYRQLDLGKKFHWHSNQNTNLFDGDTFENLHFGNVGHFVNGEMS